MFAIAYANIFGSQISTLKSLNVQGSIDLKILEMGFQELKERDPIFSEWDFDRYINFCYISNLSRKAAPILKLRTTAENSWSSWHGTNSVSSGSIRDLRVRSCSRKKWLCLCSRKKTVYAKPPTQLTRSWVFDLLGLRTQTHST